MAPTLLTRYLACPECSESDGLAESENAVLCSNCGASFDRHDDIVDFVRGSFGTALDADTYDDFYAAASAGSSSHVQQVIDLVPELAARRWGSVLEVGAGTGQFTGAFFGAVGAVDALITDVSAAMLVQCRRRLGEMGNRISRVQYATNSGEDLFVRPGAFDLVIGNGVLHHVPLYPKMLAATAQALAPGGLAVFVEPCLSFHRALATTLMPVLARLLPEPGAWAAATDAHAVADFLMYIRFRGRYRDDLEVLRWLEDKHMFDRVELSLEALDAGFSGVEVIPYGFDSHPTAVLGGYLAQVGVDPATIERLSEEISLDLPGPFARLDPLDSASSYLLVLRRGYVARQPVARAAAVIGGSVGGDRTSLKYHLSITDGADGPVVVGWVFGSQPIRYLLIEQDHDRFRFPVGPSRIDVLELFGSLGPYRPEALLYSGVFTEGRAREARTTGETGRTVSIQFDDGAVAVVATVLESEGWPDVVAS